MVVVAGVVIGLTAGSGSATSPPTSDPAASEATLPATETVAEATLPATETAAEATLPATETVATDSAWEKVVPGGDCACADGSEFNFWVREADPTKVVLFLEGGGACFDATTCAFTAEETTTYDWNISPDDEPALMGGIFNLDREENPFADYSFVYVPYCTGDVHLGNSHPRVLAGSHGRARRHGQRRRRVQLPRRELRRRRAGRRRRRKRRLDRFAGLRRARLRSLTRCAGHRVRRRLGRLPGRPCPERRDRRAVGGLRERCRTGR